MPDQPPFSAPRSDADLLPQFLDYITVECGLAENTRSAYRGDLASLGSFCSDQGIVFPDDLDKRTVVDFLERGRRAGHSTATLRRRASAIRTYYRFLLQEGRIDRSPAEDLMPPRAWEKLPGSLSVKEVANLLSTPTRTNSRTPLRDRAILELLYGAGLRVSELCGLRWRDLRIEEGFLVCRGKGSKERLVPMGDVALRAMQEYRDRERPTGGPDRIFLSWQKNPLGRESLFRLLRKYATLAGIGQSVSPHTLRHSFATHLLQGGAGLREVQELLGHADIRTTEVYTHVDRSQLKKLHSRYHPRG